MSVINLNKSGIFFILKKKYKDVRKNTFCAVRKRAEFVFKVSRPISRVLFCNAVATIPLG